MKHALSSWNPLRELEDFQDRILRAFNPVSTARGVSGDGRQQSLALTEWAPLVDIIEDEKGYLITAELPRVNKEDVKVTLENGMLTIAGERRLEKEEGDKKKYHRVERSYGCFARSFALPDDSDTSSVDAQFKDGILDIRIAKSEAARPKQIEVKVN
jgi:HSP20 family protein